PRLAPVTGHRAVPGPEPTAPGPTEETNHVGYAPTWCCPTDGEPWPCREFRGLDPAGQAYRLLAFFAHHALRDLREVAEPTTVVRRFLFAVDLSAGEAQAVALRMLRAPRAVPDPSPNYPHRPMRPLWRCSACRQDWPCEPARRGLLAAYGTDHDGLLRHLVTMKVEAGFALDRLASPPTRAALERRFVSWARRPPVPAPAEPRPVEPRLGERRPAEG
ncbi:hypothetical protein ABT336_19400, partial [Micromonospora sp. NPDC000207]